MSSILHWLFGSNSFFGKLFGSKPTPTTNANPPIVSGTATTTLLIPVGWVVFDKYNKPLQGVTVSTGSLSLVTNTDGYCLFPSLVANTPAQFTVTANGYKPYTTSVTLPNRNVDYVVGGTNLLASYQVRLDALAYDQPSVPQWTKNQLMDFQGDLLIWCPEVAPNFVNGIDPETGIKQTADNGAQPHGIIAGWVWTLWLPYYPAAKRQIIYDKIKSYGFTHVAIQMTSAVAGDTGYHGLRPIASSEVDILNQAACDVHAELLANGLVPIVAGVAPGPAASGGAAVNPKFDCSKAVVAMTDWDNTSW